MEENENVFREYFLAHFFFIKRLAGYELHPHYFRIHQRINLFYELVYDFLACNHKPWMKQNYLLVRTR